MSPTRLVFVLFAAMVFGGAIGVWWARRRSAEDTKQGTFTDIRGNSSFTRLGPAIAIAVSFAAFLICAYWPHLQKLAETFIQSLMTFASFTFGIGKGAEEVSNGGGFVGKIISKITGGSDATK
jgi:hypothetical protein